MYWISMQVCYEAIMFDGADVFKLTSFPDSRKSASETWGSISCIIKNKLLAKQGTDWSHSNSLEQWKRKQACFAQSTIYYTPVLALDCIQQAQVF